MQQYFTISVLKPHCSLHEQPCKWGDRSHCRSVPRSCSTCTRSSSTVTTTGSWWSGASPWLCFSWGSWPSDQKQAKNTAIPQYYLQNRWAHSVISEALSSAVQLCVCVCEDNLPSSVPSCSVQSRIYLRLSVLAENLSLWDISPAHVCILIKIFLLMSYFSGAFFLFD